jgi:hypothetical protein
MKATANRVSRNADKKTASVQSATAPKFKPGKTPKPFHYLSVIDREAAIARDLQIPESLYKQLQPFIDAGKSDVAPVAPGSIALSPVSQAADNSFVAPVQIGGEVYDRLAKVELKTKRRTLDVFRDALLLGLRVIEHDSELFKAVDELGLIKEEFAALLDLAVSSMMALHQNGGRSIEDIKRLEFGMFRMSQRLETSLSESLKTIHTHVIAKP